MRFTPSGASGMFRLDRAALPPFSATYSRMFRRDTCTAGRDGEGLVVVGFLLDDAPNDPATIPQTFEMKVRRIAHKRC